jgi:hypothetical protein
MKRCPRCGGFLGRDAHGINCWICGYRKEITTDITAGAGTRAPWPPQLHLTPRTGSMGSTWIEN